MKTLILSLLALSSVVMANDTLWEHYYKQSLECKTEACKIDVSNEYEQIKFVLENEETLKALSEYIQAVDHTTNK